MSLPASSAALSPDPLIGARLKSEVETPVVGEVGFAVLGSLRAVRDGVPIELAGHRQRSIVARLLLAAGRVVPAEVLVGELWQSNLQPKAMVSLQTQISLLRRVLEPERPPRAPATILVSEAPGYALRVDDVDARRFEQLCHEADRGRAADPRRAVELYDTARGLWRGAAYADFADEAWAEAERTRLTELRCTAVEHQAAALLSADEPAAVVPLVSPFVAEFSLREEAWRLLALALYRCGRQGEALNALRRARSHLAEDLGIDPGPALRRLGDDILAQAPHLLSDTADIAAPPVVIAPSDPDVSPNASAPVRTPEPVGRRAELTALRRAMERSRTGRLQVVLIAGDAGEGKTALLDSALADAESSDSVVLTVRCPENDGAPSGWPWIDALRDLAARVPPPDGTVSSWLADDVPHPDADPIAARFRVHRSVVAWLATVAARRPLVIVADDMHRADDETAALMSDILDGLAATATTALIAHRRERSPALLRVLASCARHEAARLELDGLTVDAVGELVRRHAINDLDADTVRMVAERSGGNPFFVRELVRLLDGGASPTDVPDSVRDVVRHRVDVLPARATTLLRLVAVAGREIEHEVLLAAAADPTRRDDDDEYFEALEAALLSGLLVETDSRGVAFTHQLVHDTLYDDLSALRRSRLHGRIAVALESSNPDAVTELAHHHGAAGPAHEAAAAVFSARAAELAESRFAYRDAADWWERAIAAHRGAHPAEVADRLRWHARWMSAVQRSGDVPRARQLREAVIPDAASTGDPALIAEVLLACDAPTGWSTRDQETPDLALVGLAERTADDLADDTAMRSRLLSLIARELESGDVERGVDAGREAVALARDSRDPAVMAEALNARYLWTYFDGADGLDERDRIGRELLALATAHQLGPYEAAARFILLQVTAATADLQAADGHASELTRLATAYEMPLLRAIAGFYVALRCVVTGDENEAERAYERAAAEVTATGWWMELAQALRLIGITGMRLAAGDARGLSEQVGQLMPMLPPAARTMMSEFYACTLIAAGEVEAARDELGEPLPVRANYLAPVRYAMRAIAGLGTQDRRRIDEAYVQLLPYAGTVCGAATAAVCVGPTDTILARLATARGDAAAAARHAAAAVALAERLGNATWARVATEAG